MKRSIGVIFILFGIILIPVLVAWWVTANRDGLPFYTDSFYSFFLALIAIIEVISSLEDIRAFIEGLLGPKYELTDNKLAKQMLHDLNSDKKIGVGSETLVNWYIDQYSKSEKTLEGKKYKQDIVPIIFEKLILNELIIVDNQTCRITDKGLKYRSRWFL